MQNVSAGAVIARLEGILAKLPARAKLSPKPSPNPSSKPNPPQPAAR
jgi:hypothetical protein